MITNIYKYKVFRNIHEYLLTRKSEVIDTVLVLCQKQPQSPWNHTRDCWF